MPPACGSRACMVNEIAIDIARTIGFVFTKKLRWTGAGAFGPLGSSFESFGRSGHRELVPDVTNLQEHVIHLRERSLDKPRKTARALWPRRKQEEEYQSLRCERKPLSRARLAVFRRPCTRRW